MIGAGIIVAVVLLLYFSLARTVHAIRPIIPAHERKVYMYFW